MRTANSDVIRLSSLAQTREGREVWLVEIGKRTKDASTKPALLVTAGIEGNDLVGTEAALALIERVLKDKSSDEIQDVFQSSSIYVIPRLNPDAAERYFKAPRMELDRNLTANDDDLDGLIDEDGPNDLNGDGLITWVRVEDQEGTLIPHPDDSRVLIEADAVKGEDGCWLTFAEGKDDDEDEEIDEDGLGGVNLNRNFPYDYPWFKKDAGIYQVCEKETRALAEFVVAHPNIGIAFTFSGSSNLLKAPETGDAAPGRKPQTKIRKEDAKYYEQLGEDYRELVGVSKTVETESSGGAFADWLYFHRGRFSLSSPVWSPGIALALKKDDKEKEEDAEDNETPEDEEKSDENEKKNEEKEDERGKTEIDYLKWLEEHASGYFVPWKEIEHPDYPGQKSEIGGLAPYAKVMPPADVLPKLVEKNVAFLLGLAKKLPRIHIMDIEVKPLGHGVYDLRLRIKNTGYLPTVLKHGERVREIFPTRIEIDVPDEDILGGEKNVRLGPIAGSGGNTETRYVIKAKPGTKVTFTVISALAGTDRTTVELREGGTGR